MGCCQAVTGKSDCVYQSCCFLLFRGRFLQELFSDECTSATGLANDSLTQALTAVPRAGSRAASGATPRRRRGAESLGTRSTRWAAAQSGRRGRRGRLELCCRRRSSTPAGPAVQSLRPGRPAAWPRCRAALKDKYKVRRHWRHRCIVLIFLSSLPCSPSLSLPCYPRSPIP